MIVLGLTGSIGMGKSTAAAHAAAARRPAVRRRCRRASAAGAGRRGGGSGRGGCFPGCATRPARSTGAGSDSACLAIRRHCGGSRRSCTRWCAGPKRGLSDRRGRGAKAWSCSTSRSYTRPARPTACDYVLVVSAPARVQRERVMRRPGMTESRFASILRAQMPDREKRRRADFVVPTGLGRGLDVSPVAAGRRRAAAWQTRRGECARRKTSGRQCGKS